MLVPVIPNPSTSLVPLNARYDITHAGELVEAAKEFVEQPDELLRRALRRQHRESHDVGEENAAKKESKKVRHKEGYSGKRVQ